MPHGTEEWTCDDCNKTFTFLDDMRARSVKTPDGTKQICEDCARKRRA